MTYIEIRTFFIVLILLLCPLFGATSANAQEIQQGDIVYALFGRHESATKPFRGSVIAADSSEAIVKFDNCRPECMKLIDHSLLFRSEKEAKEVADKLDENHTSVGEGIGYVAVGLAALLLIEATIEDEPEVPSRSDGVEWKDGSQISPDDDIGLEPID